MALGLAPELFAVTLAAGAALLIGGGDERRAGAAVLIGYAVLLLLGADSASAGRWLTLSVHGAVLAVLVRLAVGPAAAWTLFAAAFQLLAVICMAADLAQGEAPSPWLHAAVPLWRWLLAFTLAAAAVGAVGRRSGPASPSRSDRLDRSMP